MRPQLSLLAVGAAILVIAAAGAVAAPPDVSQVIEQSKLEAGLAVHVGTSDGRLECGLAAKGRVLVHGLALTREALAAARTAIAREGLGGLASVELRPSVTSLPYADNLVNLLIVDTDALGPAAPSEAEMLRVLCPGGVAQVRRGGQWSLAVKPRPAAMDEWTHFDRGADGNGVSRDKLVRQPHFVQWISGVQPIKLGGNPAGFINLTGIRVTKNRVFFDWSEEDRRNRVSNLACRDAFSGVPLWTVERDFEAGRKRWQLVAAGDRVYTGLKRNAPLVSLDAATGEVVTTFTAAGNATGERDENNQVRIADGKLITNVGDTLFALDAANGDVIWKHTEPGTRLMFPSASAEAKKVFVTVCPAGALARSRWPSAEADAVLCLDLATGKPVWRNEEIKGRPIGQLVYDDGLLALFAGSAIGGRGEKEGGGWLGCITVKDGKLHGQATFTVKWNTSMYNALIRDGAVYFAGHTQIFRTDPMSGITEPAFTIGYNQRCNRFCATEDLFITGYVTYLDRDFNGTLQSAARAGCALGATPANGMVYFTPSACGCFTQLRGYMAMSPEPLREAIADGQRLERLDGLKADAPRAAVPPAKALSGPIAQDWVRNERAAQRETAGAPLPNGRSIVAVVREHRIEARDAAGKVLWSFTCDGRVSQTPLVHGDTVFAGCHDGYVYAIRAADGAPQWRYLVAPYHRKMMSYGQLESSWPVYGVTLHQGLICASAGLHPEVGGGVYVVGLDPTTGEAKHRLRLAKRPATITTKAGKASGAIVPHSFVNDILVSDGESLKLPAFRTEGFAFRLDESDHAIAQRMETPAPKKR
ncbi:MAG: PQQ-binding-like beta-propeller repeat protein [Phycisphaeraceae bacterium]